MPSKSHLTHLPAALAEVALINAKTAAETGSISISQWHQEVAEGKAPQPAIRAHRFTRWRLMDVKTYWAARAAEVSIIAERTGCSGRHRCKRIRHADVGTER